eukprot:CAMPEP_0176178350 /NCGR_PEP_ID=MMETSP0120_2-20121206/91383_1 /TAXON_ID=160619 /ORGANISM="Kryptoperidinium foliaceum, Strain CCMP 1326" /LENGTH=67 /DNA_ID=CAMNT_0017516499 /DNA_START=247 /DNA_END=450 /DNA_ORIENTATION=-
MSSGAGSPSGPPGNLPVIPKTPVMVQRMDISTKEHMSGKLSRTTHQSASRKGYLVHKLVNSSGFCAG